MLEIKPVEDKEIQKKYCETAGVTYVADALAYMAFVNTMETGLCQFGIKGNVGYIYSLTQMPEKDDTEALFIMARAALSFMALCGAEIADMTDCETTDRLKNVVGFKKDENGKYLLSIKGMNEHHCK